MHRTSFEIHVGRVEKEDSVMTTQFSPGGEAEPEILELRSCHL